MEIKPSLPNITNHKGKYEFSCIIISDRVVLNIPMPQNTKQKAPDLFEYKISFLLDQEATTSSRHYLAHNARDALGMFAYAMLRNLFDRKAYLNKEFIVSKEFVRFHEGLSQSPKFQMEKETDLSELEKQKPAQKRTSKITSDSVAKVVQEMNARIEILKFEEFNRWANRWYSLKLPLEEITQTEISQEVTTQ